MRTHPLISVVIPVYNGARYLSEALTSVLSQDYHPLEVIVINDGSTDDSVEVVRRFGAAITYYQQPQQGASAARNRGVALAQGALLAFLDADDLWTKDKLHEQGSALAAAPNLSMVFGQVEQFYSPELVETAALPTLGDRQTLAGLHVGAMLIRRAAFEQVGLFDQQWQVAHFLEWYGRAQAVGLKSLVLPNLVMRRRIHTTNLGIRAHHTARRDYLRLAKVWVDQHAGKVLA